MRRFEQQQPSFQSLKNPITHKISLKQVRPQIQNLRPGQQQAYIYPSQHMQQQQKQKSTTCQSIYHGSNKQSIKNLLVATRSRNHCSQNFISMTYEDIKIIVQSQQKTMGFFTSMLCGLKGNQVQMIGCNCNQGNGGKCPWMQHWLSLSMKNLQYMNPVVHSIPKQIEQQIRKDIKRTQPSSKTFQTSEYQLALYQSLIDYSGIDPEIGYIQGMNILTSILVYHSIDVNQCVQALKFLMFNCGFRQVYLREFEFAYKLIDNLIQALKYRCYDLYRHLVLKFGVDIGIFAMGWILPMLGNVVPLPNMHMVLNIFIERGWQGFLKILISMLLYIRPIILQTHDETELMELLRTQSLKNRNLPWQQIIMSSHNVKVANFLTM